MAKKKKKTGKLDAAGWMFWLVAFVVLLGPCIGALWVWKPEEATWLFPLGMGTVTAAMAAGVITWCVNAVIQHRHKKKRLMERKKAKKH